MKTNTSETAVKKFLEGYNCAQAVLYAFCDYLDLDKNLALKLIQERLQSHINDWKEYLSPDQIVDLELVKILLDKEN